MAKSISEIVNGIEAKIREKRSTLDVSTGQLVRDIVAEAVASEISKIYDEIDDTKELASILNYDNIDETDFDKITENFGLTRIPARKATGTVTFGSYTQPTSNVRIGNVGGSGGITVQSREDETGVVVSFTTTETVYLTPTTVFNSDTGLYEVSAAVEADIAGVDSNVGVGSITQLVSSVAGVDTVTNDTAVSNGDDKETNQELYERIVEKMEGLVIGSKGGYKSLIDENSYVTDSTVVDPDNEDNVRGQFTGGVDIYVIGEQRITVDQTETSDGSEREVVLNYQPVLAISSVVGITNSVVYESAVDYTLVPDEGNFAGSTRGQDKLLWGLNKVPSLGIDYKITYVRNGLIKDLQDDIDNEDNAIINADVLVKEGVKVLVDIYLTITLNAGYSSTTVAAQVEDSITDYVNGLGLGDDLQQSDIVAQVYDDVPGVDSISLPFTRLARRGSTGTSDLTAKDYGYFRVDGDSISIVVS